MIRRWRNKELRMENAERKAARHLRENVRVWRGYIGANVEEAQGGQSRADFISKMSIALKESRETLYWLHWLRLITSSHLHNSPELDALRHQANELVSILTVIVTNARRNS